jgi:hypothetical protein
MEQRHYAKANRHSTGQEISDMLWIINTFKNIPSLVPVQSQINPVHTLINYLRFAFLLSSSQRLGLPNDFFPSDIRIRIGMHISPMRTTRSTHLILTDLVIHAV